jgi:hypothetical protein
MSVRRFGFGLPRDPSVRQAVDRERRKQREDHGDSSLDAPSAVVDRAVWLPLVTPPAIDLASARVHNYQYHPLWGLLLDQLWLR